MACGKPPRLALGPRGVTAILLLRLPMEPACGSIYALVQWLWLSPRSLQEATLMHCAQCQMLCVAPQSRGAAPTSHASQPGGLRHQANHGRATAEPRVVPCRMPRGVILQRTPTSLEATRAPHLLSTRRRIARLPLLSRSPRGHLHSVWSRPAGQTHAGDAPLATTPHPGALAQGRWLRSREQILVGRTPARLPSDLIAGQPPHPPHAAGSTHPRSPWLSTAPLWCVGVATR